VTTAVGRCSSGGRVQRRWGGRRLEVNTAANVWLWSQIRRNATTTTRSQGRAQPEGRPRFGPIVPPAGRARRPVPRFGYCRERPRRTSNRAATPKIRPQTTMFRIGTQSGSALWDGPVVEISVPSVRGLQAIATNPYRGVNMAKG